VLLLLEHPPVVTLGRNSHAEHLLQSAGVDVFEVERGGDVTFHGPGQLVGYPILDLAAYKKDLHWYLRTLEQALIEVWHSRHPGGPQSGIHGRLDGRPEDREHRHPREAVGHVARVRAQRGQ